MKKYIFLNFLCLFLIIFNLTVIATDQSETSEVIMLPENITKDFKFGFATCEYQSSGLNNCLNSNWTDWEKSIFKNGKPHIKLNQASGDSCNFWNNYQEDIKLLKDLGINSFRLSLAWERLEPEEGKFSQEAFDHYQDILDKLNQADIKPLITLHHFTHPSWFEKKGGFEKEENIKYFTRFAEKAFKHFSDKTDLWCTINEPGIYMFQGYVRGVFPPGKSNIYTALKVLRNLLKAHTEVYIKLKKLPNGDKAQIGFIHQYLKFYPYSKWNFLEWIPGKFLNYILNDIILNFLKTGKINIPTLKYCSPIEKPLDYFGLNYYSRVLLELQYSIQEPIKATCYPHEILTDMPYPIYPQGLYNAIKDVASIGVPIYITENGIADEKDNKRDTFLRGYISAMFNAITDGFDVRGYYYWTFTDNFEWDEGFLMKFGLFKVNFDTQERIFRNGAEYFKQVATAIKKLQETA